MIINNFTYITIEMKKLFFVLCGLTFISPAAMASEVRNVITDSIQLTVNGSSSQTTRLGSSYNVSGSNVSVTELGGISAGTAGTAMTITDGDYGIGTDEAAFTFSESGIAGDSVSLQLKQSMQQQAMP